MSTLSHYGKGALRVAKNYTKGYSHTQAKVRDATSNDPWPPSGRQMHEIAQLTYNQEDFVDIMEILDKRLNDKGKNWRHVFKCLTLIDYLLHTGSENVILYFKENLYIVKTLREFQYIDEEGKDQGANVRQKAKGIVSLLQDEARLRHERRTRAQMYDRMSRARRSDDSDVTDDESSRRRSRFPTSRSSGDEDDVRRALEESKREAERRRQTAEDRDLQRALELSKEDEEKRKKSLEDANLILFDDMGQPHSVQQPPTAQLVDATLPLQYVATGIQPQYTAMPLQAQYTSFNPYQQQAEQELLAAQFAQQQAEWLAMQQAQEMQVMQQAQLQAQQEEWMRQQAALQAQAQAQQLVMPQPTSMRIGSNNPFAAPQSAPPSQQTFSSSPPLSGPVSFNLTGSYANRHNSLLRENARSPPTHERRAVSEAGTAAAGPSGRQARTGADGQHSRLASLLANRGEDGIDTFGNVGNLRFAATEAGRIVAQRTGHASHNPFLQQDGLQQNGPAQEGAL
ncbi:ENTH-domain-containing protein, partial [Daedalea quercina L-15889]